MPAESTKALKRSIGPTPRRNYVKEFLGFKSPGKPLPASDEFMARNRNIGDLLGEAFNTPQGAVMFGAVPTLPIMNQATQKIGQVLTGHDVGVGSGLGGMDMFDLDDLEKVAPRIGPFFQGLQKATPPYALAALNKAIDKWRGRDEP